MALHGHIQEFNNDNESWADYKERLDQYFVANDITDAGKMKAIFITIIGAETYALLKNLLQPTLPSGKTFDELAETLKTFFCPAPIVICRALQIL